MMHIMKLQNNPFNKISYGTKTIEMRLNDDKRKKVNVGDVIEFTNVTDLQKLYCKVINLYYYKTFEDLYESHDKISIGYEKEQEANPNDMKQYYEETEIKKYGVLAIEIKKIDNEVDIGISNEFGNFKYRVGLVLIKNDKLLCMKSKKHDGYVLPGGHVEFGELSSDAALREGSEELQTKIVIKDLLCIHEYLYYTENKPFNEVCFYYIIDTLTDIPSSNFTITENDKGTIKRHDYVWLDIKSLNKKNLRPNDISKLIQNKSENLNKILITKEQKK